MGQELTVALLAVEQNRLMPVSSATRPLRNHPRPLCLSQVPPQHDTDARPDSGENDGESTVRPPETAVVMEQLGNGRSREGGADVGRRVDGVDDHAVAEGGGVGDEDRVDVACAAGANLPEDLGGGVGLNVAGHSQED